MDACRIYKRHLTHTNDTNKWLLTLMAQDSHDLLETVTSSEEIGTVDLIDLNTLRDGEMFKVTQLEVTFLFLRIDFLRDDLHVSGLSHTAHEEQTSTEQAHLNGNGEVEDNCQQECHPKHDDITLGILQNAHERAPSAHIIADDDEHTSQTSHGDILCQRHEEQEDEQEHSGVNDTCHRCAATVVDIGHRTGNSTRSGDTAKDGRRQIGHSLGNEFRIRAVAVTDDTVGHGGREQRLDSTQDGDGDSG